MSKQKEERRKAAGPQMDPSAISMNMSPIPGSPPGPGNMNGNPMNITSIGNQSASMNGGRQDNIYRDGTFMYPQSGANILNPVNTPRSQLQQNNVVGQKYNSIPNNMQQQPSPEMADQMEGMRQGQTAMSKGLQANPFMGLIGVEAMQGQMMPGALNGAMPGTSGPPLMQPMTSMNPMTPGATPKQTGKQKGKK